VTVTLTVVGDRKLDQVAARLHREARRFQRRVSSATRSAVERSYRPVLVGMVPAFMPTGYAPVLAADLKVSTTVRFAGANPGVTVQVSAPTRGKGREVEALERGTLRHPLFGQRGHWYGQRVRRGFASVPLRAIRPHIGRQIDSELAEIRHDVERG
jgi:hypothetical protein